MADGGDHAAVLIATHAGFAIVSEKLPPTFVPAAKCMICKGIGEWRILCLINPQALFWSDAMNQHSFGKFARVLSLATAAWLSAPGANAAIVNLTTVAAGGVCTHASWTRTMTVTGALVGGTCYGQLGNLQNADISSLGYTGLFKNGDTPVMSYTGSGATSGTWSSLNAALWNQWDHLYLAFHFGNGQGDPDSFIVELADGQTSGTWAMTPDNNGLSNIYLLAKDPCTKDCGGIPPNETPLPEPVSLALVGVALLGAGVARRRTR